MPPRNTVHLFAYLSIVYTSFGNRYTYWDETPILTFRVWTKKWTIRLKTLFELRKRAPCLMSNNKLTMASTETTFLMASLSTKSVKVEVRPSSWFSSDSFGKFRASWLYIISWHSSLFILASANRTSFVRISSSIIILYSVTSNVLLVHVDITFPRLYEHGKPTIYLSAVVVSMAGSWNFRKSLMHLVAVKCVILTYLNRSHSPLFHPPRNYHK